MDLDANSQNITGLLVVCLALVAIFFLMRRKYDSNMPLFFYFISLIFTNLSSMTVNPYLMIAGIAFALVSCSAIADEDGRWLPNKALTPGAIAETRTAVLCVHGYAKAHRVWRDKAGTLAKYGIAADRGLLCSRTTI